MSFSKLLCKEYLLTLDQESVLVQFYLYCKQQENSPWRGKKEDECFHWNPDSGTISSSNIEQWGFEILDWNFKSFMLP